MNEVYQRKLDNAKIIPQTLVERIDTAIKGQSKTAPQALTKLL